MDINVHDFVTCDLVSANASDLSVVNAARVSFDVHHDELQAGDEKLIDYLMRNGHGSPFEHGQFTFQLEVPIAVFREHVRHRAGNSYNEMSLRYVNGNPDFYIPRNARVQEGKPGNYTFVHLEDDEPLTDAMRATMLDAYQHAWLRYESLLDAGVAREQARLVLPVGMFTKVIWTCNPRSLMHFVSLRGKPDAMFEIQMVAEEALRALSDKMPITYESFVRNDYQAP